MKNKGYAKFSGLNNVHYGGCASAFATCTSPIIHLIRTPKSYISIVFSFSWDLQSSQENLKTIFIRHLHIPHNAHYLTPKISHSLCFSFLLDITAIPRETENNAYVRFWGANKVYYGGCESGKCNIIGGKQGVLWLM